MYLHIGKDLIIKDKNILFILNYKNLKENNIFKKFMNNLDKKNIIDISNNNAKSIIITEESKTTTGYITNISTNALQKRKFV